jgi:hypothetical protein
MIFFHFNLGIYYMHVVVRVGLFLNLLNLLNEIIFFSPEACIITLFNSFNRSLLNSLNSLNKIIFCWPCLFHDM